MSATRHHAYCDESGTKSRYMVYGGLITRAADVPAFDARIQRWRTKNNLTGEFKWTKVSRSKLDRYSALVDSFFRHAAKGEIQFKAVVFDTHDINYEKHHSGDEELGFYKLYYQFLVYKFGPYAISDDSRLWVFIDQRSGSNPVKLGTLRACLASGIKKKYQRTADVVRRVEARVSHECNMMQIADVLMGAVGFHCNGHHTAANASPAKLALAQQIAKGAGLATLDQPTPRWKKDFEVWRFRFGGGLKK